MKDRDLSKLRIALGGDPTSYMPTLVGDEIILAAVTDQLEFHSPSRIGGRLWFTFIPATNVGQFSCIELVATGGGFWVRELVGVVGTGNLMVYTGVPVVGAFAVTESNTIFLGNISCPETGGTDKNGSAVGGYVNLNDISSPSPSEPQLFASARVGRTAAIIAGQFYVAGANALRDFWIAPGRTLTIGANSANTVIHVQIQLDFPAEPFDKFANPP